jgi:hypothetical protein
MPFASISEAIEDFRAGRMLVIVDDEDRENEGDVTVAAEKVTPDIINFMATHTRGWALRLLNQLRRRKESPPEYPRPTARTLLLSQWIPHQNPAIWFVPDMFSLCGRVKAACWCGQVKRKLPWILRGLPDYGRAASSAKS